MFNVSELKDSTTRFILRAIELRCETAEGSGLLRVKTVVLFMKLITLIASQPYLIHGTSSPSVYDAVCPLLIGDTLDQRVQALPFPCLGLRTICDVTIAHAQSEPVNAEIVM